SSSNLSLAGGFRSFGGILAAGDFNGDGAADLAVPVFANSTFGVQVLKGQTGVGLQAGPTYALSLASPVAGDFNGDGPLDLAGFGSNGISAGVEPWLNSGNGTFQAPTFIPAGGVSLSSQATGDFNGDGIPDLVTASGQVQLGLGDGRFG